MTSEPKYDFDVALSYAGENRTYVNEVADHLRGDGVRVFYDEFFTTELWGQDLYTYLDNVYRERARFTVVFISRSYVSKPWPSHERQSAQARALNELGPYLLPVRFDNSILPGLRPTVSYVDATKFTPKQLAQLIKDKLSQAPGTSGSVAVISGVPRTPEEQRQLLIQRPDAWEFMLYASVLLMRRAAIEDKWRDHELRYARRTGSYLDQRAAIDFLSSAAGDASMIVGNISRLLSSDAQEAAFGAPGEPGDPASIEHLATRLIGVYEELLDWAANLRGAGVPASMQKALELAARLADGPARQVREFVDEVVAQVERLPELLERGEPVNIAMLLELKIDDDVVSEATREIERVTRDLSQSD